VDDEPRKWIAEALQHTPAQETALTFEVAVRSREIMAAHPDPADRFLVATASVYDLTLVTADESLIELKPLPDPGERLKSPSRPGFRSRNEW
jgi:PIN domain nuclease of toxin-antitoxin system